MKNFRHLQNLSFEGLLKFNKDPFIIWENLFLLLWVALEIFISFCNTTPFCLSNSSWGIMAQSIFKKKFKLSGLSFFFNLICVLRIHIYFNCLDCVDFNCLVHLVRMTETFIFDFWNYKNHKRFTKKLLFSEFVISPSKFYKTPVYLQSSQGTSGNTFRRKYPNES